MRYLGKAVLMMLLTAFACLFFGCEGGGGGHVGTDPASTGGVPSGERHIHSIGELNTAEYPLDSAAGEEKYSTLMKNFRQSYTLRNESDLSSVKAYYPRIKVLPNGSYFLIFHSGKLGGTVYYCLSDDCVNWTKPKTLFAKRPVTVNGESDTKYYMSPDACVLSDGRLVAVTSYRAAGHWSTSIASHGVCVKFSEDNGKTWGEEQVIYVGSTWEPSVIEGENGEILVFFTCVAPSIYAYGSETKPNFDHRSGGAALVRSKDGGKTWEPNVTGAPYIPQYAMRQYMFTDELGIKRYNDQMPVPLLLNNGTMALAVESWNMKTNTYKFSIAYSTDNFAEDVGLDRTGPADRQSNLFSLAGPYLAQFPSGEVVLTNHWGGKFLYRLADCEARTFYDPKTVFTDVGMWGSVEVLDSHGAVITVTTEDFHVMVARMVLNHRLHAKKMSTSLSADPAEWEGNTDALFCGSKSQAQVSVRVGYDNDNIYLLAERLDNQLTEEDAVIFYLSDGSESGYYIVEVGPGGIKKAVYKEANAAEEQEIPSPSCITASVYVDGDMTDRTKTDNGAVYEVAVPRTLLKENGQLRFLFDLVNCDREGEKPLNEAAHPDATFRKKDNWFTATFE